MQELASKEEFSLKRFLKILRNFSLVILGFLILVIVLVNLTPVQNFFVRQTTEILEKKLKTKVRVEHVQIDFLNHVLIQGLYIEDQQGDTLLYAGEARVRVTDWFIFRKEKPVIRYIGLHDAYAHLYRTASSDIWNYQFIIDAFDTGPKDKTKKQNEFELDLEKVDISNVRFHMNDAWVGSDYDIDLGNLIIDADGIDIKQKSIDVKSILVDNSFVSLRDYKGGKPTSARKNENFVDTTAFNPDGWVVKINELDLKNSVFQLNSVERPAYVNEFDPSHIFITGINLDAKKIIIVNDTIRGRIANLSANERSGFVLKKMSADVTVSPNASICENLYIETNNSIVQHYYAMHYERFPDFTEYIDKVIMVGDLSNTRVDSRDVAYFAPVLREYPTIARISGKVAGTVDSLIGKAMFVTDGSTSIKGDVSMVGLPDIYSTFINFQNGELITTNNAIFKYAPGLRKDPNVAFEKLDYIHYKGNFAGYIENFAANGTLTTNLGSVNSDIKLRVPDLNSKRAIYSGTVATPQFQLGTLLRQPLLGSIGFNAHVTGTAFDPENADLKMNAFIDHFDVNEYRYRKITAEGTLAKKKFDGNLLVDDPNLALAFYGDIDFSKEALDINAKANLLKSDLQALHLTRDSVLATADFDLDFIGKDLDDFIGYAKLYNINLVRNNHRLDVDSVYVSSSREGNDRLLVVESNDVTARIRGDYLLSALPYSAQFYVSGYLPNYIIAPTRYAPNQSLSFNVTTGNIDSLLAVLAPSVKGFNNSSINGSLNTESQQLNLNLNIPYGYIEGVHLNNIGVAGRGNLKQLELNAKVGKVVIGNNLLSASFSASAILGNDSMSFNVATKSPDVVGTLNINGHAIASGDSLYLRLLPSEFFMHHDKWEIPSGNYFVFSKNYLMIKSLTLKSGKQQIDIATENENTTQSLSAFIRSLDISTLGDVAGLAAYHPQGRIDGSVKLDHIFNDLVVDGNINAKNVRLANDTIGTINLVGSYDAGKKFVSIGPQTGVYSGESSIRAAGGLSFDSTVNQPLNGYIQFNDAKLGWAAPFVQDIVSQMTGTLNGTVDIKGTAEKPAIKGQVILTNAAMKIDVIGTHYRIPSAKLSVKNNSIDLGRTTLYDVNNNTAVLTGGVTHNRFNDWRFNNLEVSSPEFEVLSLKETENSSFYGNLIAQVKPLRITGSFDDIQMSVVGTPVAKSHIYVPVKTSTDIGSYSYISFKSYGKEQVISTRKRSKFSLSIRGEMNPLAEMTLVLDPTTGDMINAKGYGNITLEIPSDDEIKMFGNYEIEEGDYTFTLQQLAFRRNFIINSGSNIRFNGNLSNTVLDINGVYTTEARVYDLLNENEKRYINGTNEEQEAKARQNVHVLLHMAGSLNEPKLSFKLDLEEKREGSIAYQKIRQINQTERELFDQVAALLLVGSFIPQENVGGSIAKTGAINNVSELLSTTVSSQLTNIVNKLLGDPDLSLDFKYHNYNLSDSATAGTITRSQLSLGVKKQFFNDRLIVEVGSAYDWGRPTSTNANTNKTNLSGDFRVQYLVTDDGRVRLNAFRTNNYDVLVDRNVWRGGIGISYRRTFNSLSELFHRPGPPKLSIPAGTDTTTATEDAKGTW